MCNIRMLILVIISSCHLIGCMRGLSVGVEDNLDEGDQCTLENGGLGVGEMLSRCMYRLSYLLSPKMAPGSIESYKFDIVKGIACCPVNISQINGSWPIEFVRPESSNQRVDTPDIVEPMLAGDPVTEQLHHIYSYMVALGYKNKKTGENEKPIRYNCGGSLITTQHVLTAAHCVMNINGEVPVEVLLGSVNLFDVIGIRLLISKIIAHPQYRISKYYNDVAILKLMSAAPEWARVFPICLETKSVATVNITTSTGLVALGWGATAFGDNTPSNQLLKSSNLSLVNNEECNKWYTGFPHHLPHGIDDSMICVVDANTTRRADACPGDSGGPLVMSTESGNKLIGIVAFGYDCGSGIPGIYTAVYPFLNWIEQHV